MYIISHRICNTVWLCFVLLWMSWVYIVFIRRTLPYLSGLFHRHWGNRMIAPVPVEQPWRIWIKSTGILPQQDHDKARTLHVHILGIYWVHNSWAHIYIVYGFCYNIQLGVMQVRATHETYEYIFAWICESGYMRWIYGMENWSTQRYEGVD